MRWPQKPSIGLGDQCRQFAAVDLLSCILRPDALEVDHRGFDVSVSKPGLHGADVHSVTQMVGGEGVPELVRV